MCLNILFNIDLGGKGDFFSQNQIFPIYFDDDCVESDILLKIISSNSIVI